MKVTISELLFLSFFFYRVPMANPDFPPVATCHFQLRRNSVRERKKKALDYILNILCITCVALVKKILKLFEVFKGKIHVLSDNDFPLT